MGLYQISPRFASAAADTVLFLMMDGAAGLSRRPSPVYPKISTAANTTFPASEIPNASRQRGSLTVAY